ncbi:MAG: Hsp20/alpha crystallin family protein [Myxococcota bacterium]
MTDNSVTQSNRAFATPPVDIYESNEAFKLVAELPGVTAEGVKISLEQDELTLEASRQDEALDYRRRFTLNVPVDAENVKAALDKGVLELDLPKAASAKPRTIPVRVG